MASNQALNLVNKAVANNAYFKVVARDLEPLKPDLLATQTMIDAFQHGTAPAWMAAHLLGCIGHDVGYSVVREILVSAPGLLAESYAGVALARIRGNGALDDLLSLLTEAPRKVSREGAAYGLKHLGGIVAIRAIAAAGCSGHIKPQVAASILAWLPVPGQLLLELLRSDSERALLVATGVVEYCETASTQIVQPWDRQQTREIVDAVRGALERHAQTLSGRRCRYLSQWLERHGEANS